MTQILNMVLDEMVSHLKRTMVDEQPDADLKATIVKKGLLQVDKTRYSIEIGVTGGDHEDPNYSDGIVTLQELPRIGFYVPPREIGGGQLWWRRGIAKLECFFIKQRLEESVAHDWGYEILGRLMASIDDMTLPKTEDDYREHAIHLFCFSNTFFESGGPPNQFIFRGKVKWQVLCERP